MSWCLENLSAEERCAIAERLVAVSSCGRIVSHDKRRSELVGLCPLHHEMNSSFSYNYRKDVFNCSSGCGGGDLIKLYSQIRGLDLKAGFKAFLDEFAPEELKSRKGKNPQAKNRYTQTVPAKSTNNQSEVKYIPESSWDELAQLSDSEIRNLETTRGWSRAVMTNLDLRLVPIGGIKRIAIPIRDEQGWLLNIRKYAPGTSKNKVLNEKGHGHAQLWPLDTCKNDSGLQWLCEGEADTICALSHGLEAITATGGAGTWRSEFNEYFKDRDVVIAYDADLAGYNGAHKVAAHLAKVAKRVRIITWPGEMLESEAVSIDSTGQAHTRAQVARKATRDDIAQGYVPFLPAKHGKDLTDYLGKLGHSVDDLHGLLDSAEDIELDQAGDPPGISPPDTDDKTVLQLYEAGNAMARFKAQSFFDGKDTYRPMLACHDFLQDHNLIYEAKTGKIYCWNSKYWVETSEAELKALLGHFMGIVATRNRLGELVELVKMQTALPMHEDMDLMPELLNVNNGMIDLNTGDLLPHDPDLRRTNIMPYDWTPDEPPECMRFMRAALEILAFSEVVREVLEFFGYCLWPGQQYKKALFLVGPKDCGKSLLQEILRQLLGPDNCSAISMDELEKNFDRVMLHRKMANICGEASADFFSSDAFKRLTGGDTIYAAYKGVDGFTFNSSAKLFFTANEKPQVKDKSDAFYERMIMVECPRQFKLGGPFTDPYLKEKILEELPGIFHLALTKLFRLRQRGGFMQSRRTRQVLNAYRLESNHVAQFVDECCEFKTADGMPAQGPKSDVFNAYKSWAKEMNIRKPMESGQFWKNIRQTCHGKIETPRLGPKTNRQTWIVGLFLREDLPDRAFFGSN